MKLTLEHKIIAGFGVALLGLGLVTGAAVRNAARFAGTFRSVDHTHQVLYHLEQTLTEVLTVQNSSRGYVITLDAAQLEAYTAGLRDARQSIARLRRLAADNPSQLDRLAGFATDLGRLADLTARRHAVRQTGGLDEAYQAVKTGEGQQIVDRLRLLIGAMEQEERTLLGERSATFQAAARTTIAMTLLGAGLAAAVIFGAGLLVRRDFQRRRQAEQQLEDFFRLALDPMTVIGRDGRFLRVNPAWQTALGYAPAEMVGRTLLEFVHPDDVARTVAEAGRLAEGRGTIGFENRYRTRAGGWRWLQWNASPSVATGELYGAARDVTLRKETEARIAQLNADLQLQNTRLEAVNRELEAFSYSVSHDLRAPLRHVDGFAGLLAKHAAAKLDDTDRRYLATISGAARQMGRLIDDLLTFSRMGRAQMSPAPIDHDALVAQVIRDGGFDKEARIQWRLAALPPVRADAPMLRQVWSNLIENAVKYSSRSPQPCIEIGGRADAAAGECVFHVRDNGVGFDMKYAANLFGVFQRLHSDAEFEGTGIGLANVRRIVARHGGRTWAEGCVDAGAVFYFSIPDATAPTPA